MGQWVQGSVGEMVGVIKGLVVVLPELEGVAFAMYDNQVRGGVRETVKVTLGGRFLGETCSMCRCVLDRAGLRREKPRHTRL